MKDADLYFRVTGDGNLTADEAGSTHILDLGRGGVSSTMGLYAWVRVPSVTGTDTLVVTVQFDNASALGSVDHSVTFPTISAAGYYTMSLPASTRRYVGMDFNGTDVDGGGFNFGAVEAGISVGDRLPGGQRP